MRLFGCFLHVLISKPKYLVLYMNINEEKFVMSLNLKWWSRGKWENERNFLHSSSSSALPSLAQMCKLEGVKHCTKKNWKLEFWSFGSVIACEVVVKTFQKSPLVLACQINQTERQIEIHHIDIWRDMGDF